jgi:carbonic anhydrase
MEARDRASFLLGAGGAALGLTLAGTGPASAATGMKRPTTPAQALARLKAGNKRYVKGDHELIDTLAERRRDAVGGQRPYAIILSCADSRVPPELIFDENIGELFVCRVAGNILDPHVIGSIEYSVANFGSLLIMVMGHQSCGAVKDTIKLVEAGKTAPGDIQSIVETITPVVKANPRNGLDDHAYLDKIVKKNAQIVAKSLHQRSTIIRNAVNHKKLQIVSGEYSLESGQVSLLPSL